MLRLNHTKKLYPQAFAAELSTGATETPSFEIGTNNISTDSHSTPPPVSPWPKHLRPQRLVSIIDSQPLDIAYQAFHYAEKFHPGFNHTSLTYGALITRLARARHFDRAETLLSQMQSSGIKCHGEGMFINLIRNYGFAQRPNDAYRTFFRMVNFGVKMTVRSLNCLLSVLATNKRYDRVQLLFKSYKNKFGFMPDVITCNIIVKTLCWKGDINGALEVLDEMPGLGVVPNLVTYTTILVGYVRCGDLDRAKIVFQQILDKGLVPDVMTYTAMIDGYCKKGNLSDAVKLMDEMEENSVRPNCVTFSVVIEAYCKERKSGEAVNLLVDMLNQHHVPDSALCCKVIDVLCQEQKVEDACVLWKKLLSKKFAPDSAVSCTLIHWLCKKGKTGEAKKLFGELENNTVPNLLTYNELIGGMVEAGELSEAARLLDDMKEKKCMPNSLTYQMLIKAFCARGNPKEGMRLFEEMSVKGCLPNESIYSILIDELTSLGMETEVDRLLSVILSTGGRIDSKSWEVVLAMFGEKFDEASMLDRIILDEVA